MRCPYCTSEDTRVVDSRPAEAGTTIRRRRECESCANRFTTYERREHAIVVRKRDGTAEPFSPAKVLAGVTKALADRQVPAARLDRLVRDIESYAEEAGPEITTEEIGRQVLEALREIDEVAYLRFASVYKEFEGASDFEREVAALEDRG
jgi:transcriptional repressor NrdR